MGEEERERERKGGGCRMERAEGRGNTSEARGVRNEEGVEVRFQKYVGGTMDHI